VDNPKESNARERKRAYDKQWAQDNKDHKREYLRQWRARNPEKVAQYRADQKEYLREYLRGYMKEWRGKNKGKKALYNMTRRVKAKGLVADLTEEQWETIKNVFKQKCVYCGKRTRRLEKDHVIPLGEGGPLTLSNIVPACKSCNSSKGTNPPPSPLQTLFL